MQTLHFTPKEKQALKRLGIGALILFGSHAQGTTGIMSDVDIGVLFPPQQRVSRKQHTAVYNAIYDLLSSKIKQLVDIDIVFLAEAPMELQSHVATYGLVLFASDPSLFPRFRETVMDAYADFAPLRHLFHRAILERIPS